MTLKEYLSMLLMVLQVVSILCSGLAVLVAWWLSRSRARREELVEVNDALIAIERRVANMESEISHLPDHSDDVSRISTSIAEFSSRLGELNGVVSGLRRAVDLMNQHLLSTIRSP